MVRRAACHRLEQPRRYGGRGHPLSGRQRRSVDARDSALGYRLLCRPAGGVHPARALAATERLACCRRLGLCFFGLFFILYNIAIGYTTAARASLALSTLPLQTMLVGGILGIEPLTLRKLAGVCIAMFGVFAALASDLATAPPGAWRGELIMTGAVLCMAFYNVWSRPFIVRSSALGFLAVGMGAGAIALVAIGLLTGRLAVLRGFGTAQWLAGAWLGIGGGALAFILWVLALQRASPTRVASTMAVNPMAAALLAGALVGEPITVNLILGLVAAFAGIWVATTEPRRSARAMT